MGPDATSALYRIHPGIGIARLGDSPDAFLIAADRPAALPLEADAEGNPVPKDAGHGDEQPARSFRDGDGRIKRQAARFELYVYDRDSPAGRPLRLGDRVAGGGNEGTLIDVQWRVHLANKKSAWYAFRQLEGEHGYAPGHPRRNADVTAPEARRRLIIDPGPRIVDTTTRRRASFDRSGDRVYAATFPPPLEPRSIDTLGDLLTDDAGRLLVLGGHGRSGSWRAAEFGQPRIDDYANNDGWFDDTSDGPVMARLVMMEDEVEQVRFIDVEYPAWVIVGYPDYVPQIPDIVTLDEVVYDMAVREFAWRTDLYGEAGSFERPERIDPRDRDGLRIWKAGRLEWNPGFRPWFHRDVWPILWRADQVTYLTSVLGSSNFPHNQSARGTFYPTKLGQTPRVDRDRVERCRERCEGRRRGTGPGRGAARDALAARLLASFHALEREAAASGAGVDGGIPASLQGILTRHVERLAALAAEPPERARPGAGDGDAPGYEGAAVRDPAMAHEPASGGERAGARDLAAGHESATLDDSATLDEPASVDELFDSILLELGVLPGDPTADPALRAAPAPATPSAERDEAPLDATARPPASDALRLVAEVVRRGRIAATELVGQYESGRLHEECDRRCREAHTDDPHGPLRRFVHALLRRPGEENEFGVGGRVSSRTHNLPLMPLLAGDNPITNTLPSKFLRLTEYQHFVLSQWAEGLFVNELEEGWPAPDVWHPYAGWRNRTGLDLDRGVLSHALGGAFCPGGEVGWIVRNPAAYREPYRIKADPTFSAFGMTAGQANAWRGGVPVTDYIASQSTDLALEDDFDRGMQPGDLTKHMAVPWQADFNECSIEVIDVTYEKWNELYPQSVADEVLERARRSWQTLWWPAHRPLQSWEVEGVAPDGTVSYQWREWARGVPQTNAGDLEMVTEWARLGFVVSNPHLPPGEARPTESPPDKLYITVERTDSAREEG
jgi:hypothetical protein